MACLEILLHVDDKQADIIRRLITTAAMWAKLEELYKPHDGTTQLHALGALFNMCVFQEQEDVKYKRLFLYISMYQGMISFL